MKKTSTPTDPAPRDDPEWIKCREDGVLSLMKPTRIFWMSFGGRTRLQAEKTFDRVYDGCLRGNSGHYSLGLLFRSRVIRAMLRHSKYDEENASSAMSGVDISGLLCCPFCGKEAGIEVEPVNGIWDKPDRWVATVDCVCNARVQSGAIVHVWNSYQKAPTKAKAIATRKWNTRA